MRRRFATLLGALVAAIQLWPAAAADSPRIAIIIDDLGNERAAADRTLLLDGPVALAVLPHTPLATYIGEQAPRRGKEVLLHLPLQAVGEALPASLGGIGLDNTRRQLAAILAANLASIPNISGVNNHMGSLLTRHPGHMNWLMNELQHHGDLFFVDSYTTASSVALRLARELGVPATRRNVFLDNSLDRVEIDREFRRLKALARRDGAAVAIGHPNVETLAYLEWSLPRLPTEGIELVPVAELIRSQWPAQVPEHRATGGAE